MEMSHGAEPILILDSALTVPIFVDPFDREIIFLIIGINPISRNKWDHGQLAMIFGNANSLFAETK